MGWQIPICQKGLRTLKKSIPDYFCRIGIRQPRHFRYRLLFGNETKLKRWFDEEVNHPEELLKKRVGFHPNQVILLIYR